MTCPFGNILKFYAITSRNTNVVFFFKLLQLNPTNLLVR